ncbi:MAG: Rrf2 family transcriptional regulator [Lachnospiraceae bacterium]|nr:Rrf2 family transcriptional regulator [Lachnospiraceae bacterium]MCR5087506.1 Rrf2 family transcriptional regulator [Lachnospiraceae bacterium]
MKISTKGRYALRMFLDLAEHQNSGYIALKDIADRQNISKKYLEQIIPIFNSSGILRTNRGAQGGYRLAKSADRCTIGEVLRLTEGSLAPVACGEEDPVTCERSNGCAMLSVWQGLYKVISEYLDSITLQDVLDRSKAFSDDYVI